VQKNKKLIFGLSAGVFLCIIGILFKIIIYNNILFGGKIYLGKINQRHEFYIINGFKAVSVYLTLEIPESNYPSSSGKIIISGDSKENVEFLFKENISILNSDHTIFNLGSHVLDKAFEFRDVFRKSKINHIEIIFDNVPPEGSTLWLNYSILGADINQIPRKKQVD
jgi:hypothetical protein